MNDRDLIRTFEAVHDRRLLAFAFVALLSFMAVLIGIVAGFRGNHVARSADAMVFATSPPAVSFTGAVDSNHR